MSLAPAGSIRLRAGRQPVNESANLRGIPAIKCSELQSQSMYPVMHRQKQHQLFLQPTSNPEGEQSRRIGHRGHNINERIGMIKLSASASRLLILRHRSHHKMSSKSSCNSEPLEEGDDNVTDYFEMGGNEDGT